MNIIFYVIKIITIRGSQCLLWHEGEVSCRNRLPPTFVIFQRIAGAYSSRQIRRNFWPAASSCALRHPELLVSPIWGYCKANKNKREKYYLMVANRVGASVKFCRRKNGDNLSEIIINNSYFIMQNSNTK